MIVRYLVSNEAVRDAAVALWYRLVAFDNRRAGCDARRVLFTSERAMREWCAAFPELADYLTEEKQPCGG